MPTKYRKKKKQFKEWYAANADKTKYKVQQKYNEHPDTAKTRTAARKLTDKTGKKLNTAATHKLLDNNFQLKERNLLRARVNTKRRLAEDALYKKINLERAKGNTKRCLTEDARYKKINLERAKANTKRRLTEDARYKKINLERAKENTKRRLTEDARYKKKNLERARIATTKRLLEDRDYRRKNLARAKVGTAKRLTENDDYRNNNRMRAKVGSKRKWEEDKGYRDMHRKRVRDAERKKIKMDEVYRAKNRDRHNEYRQKIRPNSNAQKHKLTKQQQYWSKRKAFIANATKQNFLLLQQKRMLASSKVHLIDIKLLFNKAEHTLKCALAKLRTLHSSLSNKVTQLLETKISESECNNGDNNEILRAIFGPTRTHTSSSEPYFWEQAYRTIPPDITIAVDVFGRAHIFEMCQIRTCKQVEEADTPNHHVESNKAWLCRAEMCNIDNSLIEGTQHLMDIISTTTVNRCVDLYREINVCNNPARTNNLGHPVYCNLECVCTSLLRPALLMSCHFPVLRTIVRRVYELRRIALDVHAVKTAMNSGDFELLKSTIIALNDNLKVPNVEKKKINEESVNSSPDVSEEQVMTEFGKALRTVVTVRDTYTTTSCDVCEQLRTDLQSLRSYQNRKGFDCDKMNDIIELLYINKTQFEDVNQFIDSTMICRYCADKLRGNKDVARSIFNRLAVIETPECIKKLNLFERSLIKQCVTSIAVVRLGQISNKNRPQKELNSALKGRIAYLPVDVTSSASFLPDQLLNPNSLVVLVGGQPTSKQKVWVSAVDLSKVHTALAWLRTHNALYKDVPAYTVEEIKQRISDKVKDLQEEQVADCAFIKKLDEASKTNLYENFTVQPLSADFPVDTLIDYQFNKLGGLSSNIFDSELDLKTYPELFPTGENGMRDALRKVKIGTSDYIKSRLLSKHSKFRLNINYLFHCFQVQEVSNMCHSVGHMLRSVTGKKLSAKEFHDRLVIKDGEVQSKMFSLLANLRGTKEFFAKLGMDVRWMIKRLGPPTLFITCSTAEWYSAALINHIRTINSDVANIDKMTPAELCAMDPVTVTNHFYKKWEAIFSKLINHKDTPLFGAVQDFFWRIEYQARGAPHVHCVLWIKDAPILGKNSNEEVTKFIDKLCTCSKPDPTTSPTLSTLVSQFQVHKCNKYCQKIFKRNGKFCKKCRFGFPRSVEKSTQLHDVIDCLAVGQKKLPRKRLYHLKRRENEKNINDYNPALLLANEANVDVQFIGHVGSRLPYYITEYMTKAEKSEQDSMWQDIFTSSKSLGTNAMSFMLKSVKSRQVGANEASDRLLGHKLYSKSRQMRFVDLQAADKVKRVLKPAADIESLLKTNPESEDIFFLHWVIDIYPARADEMENTSLYEILEWYEREKVRTKKAPPLTLKGLNIYLRRRRNQPYIVTHHVINPHQSDDKRELYFYYLLKLFKPWRQESDLSLPGISFTEMFKLESKLLPLMVSYHNETTLTAEQDKQTETAVRERAETMQERDDIEGAVEDDETALEGCVEDPAMSAMQEVIETCKTATINDSVHNEDLLYKYQALNVDQKRVVDSVVSAVSNDKTIYLVVSGQGGTGKSRVINILHRMISKNNCANCLSAVVSAPTGLAAFHIGGTTIHRLLLLPVEHGKPANYSQLGQEQLIIIRQALKGLKLLIIDEVSMVSSLTLLYVHLRLTEITNKNELFGGISVVFFADFLQLPPVKGNQPFLPVTFLEAKQRIGSVASPNIWKEFQYDELTINMRQSGDQLYAQMLSNIRIGIMNDQEQEVLSERLVSPGKRATIKETCERYKSLIESGKNPLILMPRSAQCNDINSYMLKQIGNEIVKIQSIDTQDTIVSKQMMTKVAAAFKKTEQDTTRTAGLESNLNVCIGARVMLRRNKNVETGLVNGCIGTVEGFMNQKTKTKVEHISTISVKFDHLTKPVRIERESCSFEVLKGIYYTRKQFPIMLAFSITIHKAQGLSLETAIVDAGPGCFGSGMVYVALSRVTSQTGLHLIDFDRTRIVCDQKAITEYNRLRRTYTPHLGDLCPAPILKQPGTLNQNEPVKLIKNTRTTTKSSHSSKANRHSKITVKPCQKGKEQPTMFKSTHKRPVICNNFTITTNEKRSRIQSTKITDNYDNECINEEVLETEISNLPHEAIQIGLDNIFRFCQVSSADNGVLQETCSRLNIKCLAEENTNRNQQHYSLSAHALRVQIEEVSGKQTTCSVLPVSGDGNCLFRALSLAVTGTQEQHLLLRSYFVNHMLHEDVKESMQGRFKTMNGINSDFYQYLLKMECSGVWGTELEIISAAHLLNCSIICLSRYSEDGQFCLQHFPPHFVTSPTCFEDCQHNSIYLVNLSGAHYETAVVTERLRDGLTTEE